eukprot:GHVP01069161.1.p2 GENE.GHVP01069161.1~~GHVP01069161.1.p2  ORF type:complete len:385 (-),score=80.20 GHVP01069161.1:1895-3049(-)
MFAICCEIFQNDENKANSVFSAVVENNPKLSIFAFWIRFSIILGGVNGKKENFVFGKLHKAAGISWSTKKSSMKTPLELLSFKKKAEIAIQKLSGSEISDDQEGLLLMSHSASKLYVQLAIARIVSKKLPDHCISQILDSNNFSLASHERLLVAFWELDFEIEHLTKIQILGKMRQLFPSNRVLSSLESSEFIQAHQSFELRILQNQNLQKAVGGSLEFIGQTAVLTEVPDFVYFAAVAELQTYSWNISRIQYLYEPVVAALGETLPRIWIDYCTILFCAFRKIVSKDVEFDFEAGDWLERNIEKGGAILLQLEKVSRRGLSNFGAKELHFFYIYSSLRFLFSSAEDSEDLYLSEVAERVISADCFAIDPSEVFSICSFDSIFL